ncbi:hypothetical protein F511_16538 [Dorcoceras hygrometricum]|uniref:Uncharacterized protein n=1 Tax=Dorcoceras hygrometricum TaxID=472368 RepID=A0A2Z7C1P0_9LAMI|nr:hypothetical protein F511_16538 [Dorcoceras hygrometricum]
MNPAEARFSARFLKRCRCVKFGYACVVISSTRRIRRRLVSARSFSRWLVLRKVLLLVLMTSVERRRLSKWQRRVLMLLLVLAGGSALRGFPPSITRPPFPHLHLSAAACRHAPPPLDRTCSDQLFEELPSVLISSGLLVQADEGTFLPVVDLIRRFYRRLS